MKLTTSRRNALSDSSFAGPGRSYPVEDSSHAANAKARAKQQLDAGRLSQDEYRNIVRKANMVLALKS